MYLSTGVLTTIAAVGQVESAPRNVSSTPADNVMNFASTPGGIVVCLVAMALVATLISVLTVVVLNHRAAQAKLQASLQISEMETQLKQEMLERGMSADEVCRVLQTPISSAPHEPATPVARQFGTRSG